MQPKYEGKTKVGLFLAGGSASRNHRVEVRSIQVQGNEAMLKGRHTYDVDLGFRTLNQDFNVTWKFRKEGDAWKIYEWDTRG